MYNPNTIVLSFVFDDNKITALIRFLHALLSIMLTSSCFLASWQSCYNLLALLYTVYIYITPGLHLWFSSILETPRDNITNWPFDDLVYISMPYEECLVLVSAIIHQTANITFIKWSGTNDLIKMCFCISVFVLRVKINSKCYSGSPCQI